MKKKITNKLLTVMMIHVMGENEFNKLPLSREQKEYLKKLYHSVGDVEKDSELKTAITWFRDLDPDVGMKARENSSGWALKKKHKSLSDALLEGFEWRHTPEGQKYWLDMYNKIANKELNSK